jgi:hypothetical protein
MMKSFVTSCQGWRYLFLFGALLALLVIQPIVSAFGILEWLFDGLFVLVMAVLVLALAQDKCWRAAALALCIPAAALVIGGHVLTPTAQHASLFTGHAIGAFFFVLIAAKVIRSIFAAQELTWDSVIGAICGYLLLGIAWGLTYSMIYAANPESFQFGDAMRPHLAQADYSRNVFIYYSFVTLTTIGYGDVTPISIPARTLSWVEAVTGQLYLVVLIAGLISALVAKRHDSQ